VGAFTCDHDVVDILGRPPLSQIGMDSANVIDVQKTALWFTEQARVVLDCVPFCWCVDDGEHLFEMVLDQLMGVRLLITL
jgi:hypothetical protein